MKPYYCTLYINKKKKMKKKKKKRSKNYLNFISDKQLMHSFSFLNAKPSMIVVAVDTKTYKITFPSGKEKKGKP